jgi:glutamine cyclotransferase
MMLRAMPDATITATTSIDTSGFGAGLEILKEQYRQATTEVRQSVQRVVDAEKQATDAIAAGHVQLGATLQAVAAQEKAALNSVIEKQQELKAVLGQGTAAAKAEAEAAKAAAAERVAASKAAAQAAREAAEAHPRILESVRRCQRD